MMKSWLFLPCIAFAMSGWWITQPLEVATAFTAHVLCSETFVAKQDPEAIFSEYVQRTAGINWLGSLLQYHADRNRQEVRATIAGTNESLAVYREGRGCTVVRATQPPASIGFAGTPAFTPDPLGAPPAPVKPADPKIGAALDRTFAELPGKPYAGVKAVVIVHNGRIIGERYAPGYGPDTPMLGWSMAKSVTNALIGILVRRGRLSISVPAPVAAWSDARDPRRQITLDHLLRQTSGQPFGSASSGFGPSARMQFLEPDTAAFAAAADFVGKPGERWAYTDGNFAILSGIIRDHVGGTAEAVARFARTELFAPLGMTSAVQEFDMAGAPMGGSYLMASARDWARLGLLYANDGVAGSRHVLPVGWADYSAQPTDSAWIGYGAGFWTNRGSSRYAADRRDRGMPADSFFAAGNFGQRVVVSPSEHLVIVRMGFSQDDDGVYTMERTVALTADVVAALHGRQ
jgi:CubicO group peptidase (beta-lactamase class C family)